MASVFICGLLLGLVPALGVVLNRLKNATLEVATKFFCVALFLLLSCIPDFATRTPRGAISALVDTLACLSATDLASKRRIF
jgi:hypothetical protein